MNRRNNDMRNKKFTKGIATLSVAMLLSIPMANASEEKSEVENKTETNVNLILEGDSKNEATPLREAGFKATVVLKTEDNLNGKVLELENPGDLSNLLKDLKLDINDFENSEGFALSEDYKVKNKAREVIQLRTLNREIEKITLNRSVEEKPSAELFVGEEKVIEEGADGLAVKTTRKDGSYGITVLKSPIKKVVAKGTKEKPVVEQVESSVANNAVAPQPQQVQTQYQIAPPPSNVNLSNGIVASAYRHLGKPYVWGGTGGGGFDCSGLVQAVFAENGYSIPRVSSAQGSVASYVPLNQLQPGDILWNSQHVGIYVGNGQMIHAGNPSTGVELTSINWFVAQGAQGGRF